MTEDRPPEDDAPDGDAGSDDPGPGATAAERVIAAFGGIRPLAGKLGVAVSTVQGWKQRAVIPAARHAQIRAVAESHGIGLDEADLAASGRPADAPAHGARTRRKAAAGPAPIIEAEPVEPGETFQADAAAAERAAGPAQPGPIIEAEPVEPDQVIEAEPVEPDQIIEAEPVEPDEPIEAEPDEPIEAEPDEPEEVIEPAQVVEADGGAMDRPAAPGPVTGEPPTSAIPGTSRRKAASAPGAKPAAPWARPGAAGWLVGFVLGAVVMALGFGGAVLTVDFWYPGSSSGSGTDAAVAALEQSVQQSLAGLRGDLEGRAGALEDRAGTLEDRAKAFDSGLGDLQSLVSALPAGTTAPAGPDPMTTRALDDLAAQLDALRGNLQQLEAQGGAPALTEDQLAALSDADQTLTSRFAALEARLGELDRLDGLEGDLDGLERNLADLAARSVPKVSASSGEMALVLAVVQLRDAARGPAPYAAELELLAGLAAGDGELAALLTPLGPRAATGLPTLTALSLAFPEVAGAIVASGAGEESDGLMSGVWRRLSEVVSVRPLGDVEGSAPGAIAARAEHRLRGGNLAGAVAELDGLAGKAAEAAAAWRAEAEVRLAADAALAALGARVIARLVPAGG